MLKEADTYHKLVELANSKNITVPINSSNLEPFLIKYLNAKPGEAKAFKKAVEEPRLLELDNYLSAYASATISLNVLLSFMTQGEYISYSDILEKCQKYRSARTITNRDMQVIWITGSSGSGKTTLAKYFADKMNYEAFITANGDNLFDSYDLQPCIIVDEFRASTMKFSTFLQLTDNHTNKQQGARYHNVDMSKCKLMIITSINSPDRTYSMFRSEDGSINTEPVEQLNRRLKHRYYKISNGIVFLMDTANGAVIKQVMKMDTIFDYFKITPSKSDESDILEQFYDKSLDPLN